MTTVSLLIIAGALLGGFVNGLSGFGTTLVALPFWVHAVSPVVAAQLGAVGGVVGNLQTLRAIWPEVRWRDVARYVLAGLVGVPLGTLLLPMLAPRAFKLGVGTVIVLFALFQLASRNSLRWRRGGAAADTLVGFLGGFLGGLAGMSGPLPTMWASLRGLDRVQKRVLFQSFNTVVLTAMLTLSAVQGLWTMELGRAVLLSIPAAIVGSRLGHALYVRLPGNHYEVIVLALLLASGLSLLWGNL